MYGQVLGAQIDRAATEIVDGLTAVRGTLRPGMLASAQLFARLKLTDTRLGILAHYNVELMKHGIERVPAER